MRTRTLTLPLLFVGLLLAGCSSDPLVGTWRTTIQNGGGTANMDLAFQSDGSLSVSYSVPNCSGMVSLAGLRWSSTTTRITIIGTTTCSGSINCPGGTLDCSAFSSTTLVGSDAYQLANDNMTLTYGAYNFMRR
jgi:hypothetical protein